MSDTKILSGIDLTEVSLVKQGANQFANVVIAKDDMCKMCGAHRVDKAGGLCKSCGGKDGTTMAKGRMCKGCGDPMGEKDEMCKGCGMKSKPKGRMAKMRDAIVRLFGKAEEPEMPALTNDRLAQEQFWRDWTPLRQAFESSIDGIVYSDTPNKVEAIRTTTEQFLDQLERLSENMESLMLEHIDTGLEQAFGKELTVIPTEVRKVFDGVEENFKKEPDMATVDVSKAIEEAVAKAKEEMAKELEVERQKRVALEKAAADAAEVALTKELEAKVSGVGLAISTADVAEVYKHLHKTAPALLEKLHQAFTALKAQDNTAAKVVTEKAIGTNASGNGAGVHDRVEAMAKELMAKEKGLSKESAIARVYTLDKALYAEALKEAGYNGVTGDGE